MIIFAIAPLVLIILIIALCLLKISKARRWWKCAWCKCWFNDFSETQMHQPDGTKEVSHGICPSCSQTFNKNLK